jgi:hypothetical protein
LSSGFRYSTANSVRYTADSSNEFVDGHFGKRLLKQTGQVFPVNRAVSNERTYETIDDNVLKILHCYLRGARDPSLKLN